MRCPVHVAAIGLVAFLANGCVAAPAEEHTEVDVRTESRLDADDTQVRAESPERAIREATLRVRTRTCLGVGSGSGFAVDDRVLVTNRHVVEGADAVQVTTWDGQSFDVAISGVAATEDLALVLVDGQLPVTLPLHRPPQRGDTVTAVGYPGGGELEFSNGEVVGTTSTEVFGQEVQQIRVTNQIQRGNSGGPLLDEHGRVVGIVHAIHRQSGDGLAVPVDALQRTANAREFFTNPSPC